jgi:hypothetical protein
MLIKNSYLVGEVEIVSSLGEGNHDTNSWEEYEISGMFCNIKQCRGISMAATWRLNSPGMQGAAQKWIFTYILS